MFSANSRERQDFFKDLLSGALKTAGKGKDEFITILGREMGLAFAAMVKEPIQKIIDSKRLKVQFEIELVDKDVKSTKKKRKSAK